MNLDPPLSAEELYAYRYPNVHKYRPLFTGDVFDEVNIHGIGDHPAVIVEHPCSIRRGANLRESVLVAAVKSDTRHPDHKWIDGYFNRMPLPDLSLAGDFHVGRFDMIGRVESSALSFERRVACLYPKGINQLQQRLVCYLTRCEIPTHRLDQELRHTYEEAQLAERWLTDLSEVDSDPDATFHEWFLQDDRRERLKEDPRASPALLRETLQEIRRRQSQARATN